MVQKSVLNTRKRYEEQTGKKYTKAGFEKWALTPEARCRAIRSSKAKEFITNQLSKVEAGRISAEEGLEKAEMETRKKGLCYTIGNGERAKNLTSFNAKLKEVESKYGIKF